VGPQEIKKLHPYINVTDLEGGVWVPEDCIGNPQVIGRTLASLAEKGGARYRERSKGPGTLNIFEGLKI
jgi:Glycine/D-amino acid oxidases (deaminating)